MLILALMLAAVFVTAAWMLYTHAESRKVELEGLERRIASQGGTGADMPRSLRIFPVPAWLEPWLARAQIEPTPRILGLAVGAAGLVFCIALVLQGFLLAVVAVLALAAGMLLFVRERARRRTEAFLEALPFFLDTMRQLLAVGNSLSQALLRAVASSSPAIQNHLGGAARRIELGAPLGDSLQHVADRLAIPELAMLAAAVRSNLRFGGPMAGIIGNLVHLVRERSRVKRELAAATAEVRISARLLIALPLALTAFLFLTIPSYRHFFFDDPRGHQLAMAAIVMQGLGVTMMIRLQRLVF